MNLVDYIKTRLDVSENIHPVYSEAIEYILCSSGKFFRSGLFFTVIKSYNSSLVSSSMDVAFAIESVHTYSLIHDDLPMMDNSPLRRGVKTLHVKYDEVTALLVGDALNSYAYELISKSNLESSIKIDLIKSLSTNSGMNGMVLGQAVDCYFENSKIEFSDVEKMHINKTAKLIACSLQMGAIIANLSENMTEKLYSFGLDLGLLFQIQDDILDVTLSEDKAGKPVNNDGSKNSFINHIGLNNSIAYADKLVDKIEDNLNGFDTILKENLLTLLSSYIYRHKE